MATLKNVGKTVQSDSGNTARAYDLVDEDYISTLIAANMSQGAVNTLVATNLLPYASVAYANTAMSGLATPAYVISVDANYIPLSTIGQPNGPIALGAGGRVSPGVITTANTQRWPSPFWTPATYASGPLTSSSTATQLFTLSQPNPGYTYKLMVTGMVDTSVDTDNGEYPQVLVRQGSTTGPIVASGYGIAESYGWSRVSFSYATESSNLNTSVWTQYAALSGSTVQICANFANEASIPGSKSLEAQRARNLNSTYGTTVGDLQVITMTMGATAMTVPSPIITPATNDIYGRLDSTGNTYIRCKLDGAHASLLYRISSGSEVAIGSPVACTLAAGDVFSLYCGTTTSSRQFALYQNGSLIGTWTDSGAATAMGAGYRGWGFGMGSGAWTSTYTYLVPYDVPYTYTTYTTYVDPNGVGHVVGTTHTGYTTQYTTATGTTTSYYVPSTVAQVGITDPGNAAVQSGNNYAPATITPVSLSSQSALTGATTLYVMLARSGSASTVTSATLGQGLWVMPVPA